MFRSALIEVKRLFTTNVKTVYTNPQTIWYSQRYNSGERFILHNESFTIPLEEKISHEYLNTPLHLSQELEGKQFEYFPRLYEKENSFQKNFDSLTKMFRYADIQKLNESVAVYARYLYASTKVSSTPNEELMNLIFERFLEKIDLADVNCLLHGLEYINHSQNGKDKIETILRELSKRTLLIECTEVKMKYPHWFRYKESSLENSESFKQGYREVKRIINLVDQAQVKSSFKKEIISKVVEHIQRLQKTADTTSTTKIKGILNNLNVHL